MQILGIVNLTRDSFSDGGRYLDAECALAHARRLVADGADLVDLGAESTNPDGESVSANEEIRRLTPVAAALKRDGVAVSIDTYKPSVMQAMLALGVDVINDVTALGDPASIEVLRGSTCRIIVMHSTSSGPRAERADVPADTIVDRILAFFDARIAMLVAAGIARERLILDPGMGFFLGRDPRASLTVLKALDRLRRFGLPLCVSTSRKSFIGAVLGSACAGVPPGRQDPPLGAVRPDQGGPGTGLRPVDQRAAGTLASELWALTHGADFIRTHDVRSLRDAERTWRAIERA